MGAALAAYHQFLGKTRLVHGRGDAMRGAFLGPALSPDRRVLARTCNSNFECGHQLANPDVSIFLGKKSRGRYLVGGLSISEFALELWSFLRERKKFWLLPILIFLIFLGALIVLTEGSAVAPFIYTLF